MCPASPRRPCSPGVCHSRIRPRRARSWAKISVGPVDLGRFPFVVGCDTRPRGGTHAVPAVDLHRRERRRRGPDGRGARRRWPSTASSARRWASAACSRAASGCARRPTPRPCACATARSLTSDGPFAETKEQIGGYFVVDCKDLDEAIEVAAQDPGRPVRLDRGAADLGDVSPRRRGRGRRGVPRGVGPRRRDADPRDRRLGPRRGMRAGRLRAGPRTLAARRRPAQSRRVAHDDRAQPRASTALRRAATGAVEAPRRSPCSRRDPTDRDARRRQRRRRRPAAADLHVLPPRARRSTRRSRSRCARSPGSRPPRSRARSSCPSRRWRSGSCARSARSATPASRTACRPAHLLPERTAAVLAVLYLLFNEGYAATRGRRPRARAACAPRRSGSARTLAALMPDEPEALGLLALMLLHDARRAGACRRRRRPRAARGAGPHALGHRRDRRGRRAARRRAAARRARSVPGAGRDRRVPRDRADRGATPTGPRSPALYGELGEMIPSPVVELNRAVAVAMADGPEAGLALVDDARRLGRARRLPPAARDPRRPAAPARPSRRSGGRLPRRARPHDERRRAPLPRAPTHRGDRGRLIAAVRPSPSRSRRAGCGRRDVLPSRRAGSG